jgi:type IV pilus assembly protein PilN
MYNLDVNFLNDRPDLKPGGAAARAGVTGRPRSAFSSGNDSKTPLYAGIATLVGLLGLTVAAFSYFTWQKGSLAEQQADLDTKLGTLEAKRNELAAAKKKVSDAEGEIKALASVFTQIKPWSAISQDIRDRLPEGVQILGINQAASQAAGQTVTGPDAVYTRNLTLKGKASSFEQVNNFLVVLQKSSFLKPDSTKIVTADREAPKPLQLASLPNPIQTPNSTAAAAPKPITPAPLIGFTIQTELTDVSSAELRKELERKGAVGLMSRFDALKSKGVKP